MSLLKYTYAVRLYQLGRKEEAARLLSEAFGHRGTLPVVKNSVDELLSERAIKVTESLIRGALSRTNTDKG
jgi:hypothetical protein